MPNTECADTGERMLPMHARPEVFWEHVYRYRFALPFTPGKRMLDVACGEGYGAAAMSQHGAQLVIGIDSSAIACQQARSRYGIRVCCADAEHMPFNSRAFDAVVSFETIEHLRGLDWFIAECARVLASNGSLVLSTPNREPYGAAGRSSDFHYFDLSSDDLVRLIKPHFQSCILYGQHPSRPKSRFIRSIRGLIRHLQGIGEPGRTLRQRPIDAVRRSGGFLSRYFNPYVVECPAFGAVNRYQFLIAAARLA